jgi:hypothetical protein
VSWLELLVVVAIIGFVIYQQIAGQRVQGSRLVMLPAVITVIGFVSLHGAKHLDHADYLWLTVGAIGSVLIGLAGIPFAPEKDGRTFGSGAFKRADHDHCGRY